MSRADLRQQKVTLIRARVFVVLAWLLGVFTGWVWWL